MPKATDVIQTMANDIEDHMAELYKLAGDEKAEAIDPRWLAVARTHFQEGLMAARKAVFNEPNKY